MSENLRYLLEPLRDRDPDTGALEVLCRCFISASYRDQLEAFAPEVLTQNSQAKSEGSQVCFEQLVELWADRNAANIVDDLLDLCNFADPFNEVNLDRLKCELSNQLQWCAIRVLGSGLDKQSD